MIKSLTIKNFQSHLDSQLDFSNKVNAIIGTTDSGKSSIIRSLDLVCNNRPSGTEFINANHDLCEVNIETENHNVTRKKNNKEGKNSINQYIINEEELNAVGVNVPEEIEKALNISDLNIQYQMDAPFLLSESAGEIARVFNRVVNLNVIDDSLRKIESEKRSITNTIKIVTKQKDEAEENIKQFDRIPQMEADLKVLEILESNISDISKGYNHIIDLLNEFDKIDLENPILRPEGEINKLLDIEVLINTRAGQEKTIKALIYDYTENFLKLKAENDIVKKEGEIIVLLDIKSDLDLIIPEEITINSLITDYYTTFRELRKKRGLILKEEEIDSLNGLTVDISAIKAGFKTISDLTVNLDEFTKKLENMDTELNTLEMQFYENLPEKCSPDVCPLLNKEIK